MTQKTNQISNGVKKILFMVTQSEFGGAQRYIYEIARSLNPENYEILVAAGEGDGELFNKISNLKTQNSKLQLKTQKLNQLKRAPWPWQIFLSIGEIHHLLKKEKPDVLFLCSTTAGLLGSLASFFYRVFYRERVSVIYRIGGWAFRDPRAFWKNWLILLAEKLTTPLKDKIIVNSEIDRKLALKYKIAPEKKLIKIYNGIDPASLTFFSREQALLRFDLPRRSNLLIGCVANFYKTKGLTYLIEAFARSDLPRRSDLLIIGEGRLRPKLEGLIKKYGLENKVLLVGRIPDAYQYLKAFDVFVLPSLKEGFPWIILEAIAARIPIIATKVGAIPEILEQEFLVAPANSQALAKKISWMLEHPAKAELKQEFTCQKMIEETEKVLFSYNLIQFSSGSSSNQAGSFSKSPRS